MAKEGFCSGDPEKVLEMSAEMVLAAVQYVKFQADYLRTWQYLNKGQQ